MTKEPPIMVVNKPRKTTSRKRTSSSSSNTTSSGGPKRRTRRSKDKKKIARKWEVPSWIYYILMGGAAALLVIGFYYFFIRPYAYRWKPCYGTKAYGVCLPSGYRVHGFDISHHQGEINWAVLSKTQFTPFPIRFVFLKASEGGDFSDTTFVHNRCFAAG